MKFRRVLLLARLITGLGALLLRKRARFISWALHDFLWLYPTLKRNCTWHGPIVRHFETEQKEVWLTIDDGPDPRDTPGILDLLRAHNAKASFFAIGHKVDAHRDLCRRIVSEGHSLENHTYSHPVAFFWALPCCLMKKEIERCTKAIQTATGTTPSYFRSPVGMTNSCVHPAAVRNWLRVTGWSAEGRDGLRGCRPGDVVARILHQLQPGSIILLHESSENDSRVETLALLLEKLSAANWRCVIPPNFTLH